MWKDLKVTMQFENKLCGSVPQSKELVKNWLNARMPKNKPEDARPIEELEQEVLDTIQETEERTTLSFQSNEKGFFVRGGTIKAHLKDCANQIKELAGVKGFRSKIANKLYVMEYHVYLERGGDPILTSDGSFEQPVHAWTPQGTINALKIIHYVEKPVLQFNLRLLEDKEVTEERVRQVFEYGAVHGYGGERSMGEGRYSFTLE